ncbi:MAG: hypothetical protein ACTHLO_15150 [Pseudolabrys sp.]
MLHRPSYSELFSINLREAQDAARALAESVSSIDTLIAQTREVIADSRRVIALADTLLSRACGGASKRRC